MNNPRIKKIMEECFRRGAKAYRDGKTVRDNPFTHGLSHGSWLNGFKMAQAGTLDVNITNGMDSVEHVERVRGER